MDTWRIGQCQLRLHPFELLTKNGQPVRLRNNSLSVLEVLASKPYQLVSREELLDRIWPNSEVAEEGLSQCIRDIRRTIADSERDIVQTVYKRGYRLNPVSDGMAPLPEIEYGDAVPFRDYPEFKQNTGFTKSADGVGIAYASSGSGPVVIRAPNWLNHLDWDWRCEIGGERIRKLSERLHHIRFDSRGTGRSDRNVGAGGINEWCDDLHAVATASGHKKFALMGISGGAPTCLQYAALHPKSISCVVLLGGFARGNLARGTSIDAVNAMEKLIESGWGYDNASIRQIMTTQLWPSATIDQIASFNHLQQVSTDGVTAAQMISNISRIDVTQLLPNISQPTLIVHSRNDFRQPLAEAELMAEKIPNAELCILESNNHTPMPQEAEFERMIYEVTEFIISHSPLTVNS